jgi:hypothetical protein
MQKTLRSAAVKSTYRKSVLLGALALLAGVFDASAQSTSKSQSFSATYTPPATGSTLGFSAARTGSYFSNASPTATGSFGTYGVANTSNGVGGAIPQR